MIIEKKRICIVPALLGFLLLLMACATIGREFPVDPVSQIQIGKTTKDNISHLFGPPWRTGIEDGNQTWTYGYYRYKLLGKSITRDLVVRFRTNGVVDSYSFNTSDIQSSE